MEPVLVRGDGVAAYCCVHLLGQAGIPVQHDRPRRPRLPAIMLSEAAIGLIADVFGRRDLFCDLPRIQSRVVLWGPGAEAVSLPHSAVMVSEEALLDSIRPDAAGVESDGPPVWQVFASAPLPSESVEQGFGSRVAHASAVELRNGEKPGCWVESVENGWLFLIGTGGGKGWLLSVGSEAVAALERSRLVAGQIARLDEARGTFPAFPRIGCPLSGTGETGESWLVCGTAAMAFDPICGDGSAQAVREAILAVAAIRAAHAGAPIDDVRAHYEARITAGFGRHLANCADYYRSGGLGPWWRTELEAVERGLGWCGERMSGFPPFRYRLNGYTLEAVS